MLQLCTWMPTSTALALTSPEAKSTKRLAKGIRGETYILGPGDTLRIELYNIPELSGFFSVAPDGTLTLPYLRSLVAEGLSINELRFFLEDQFKSYVKNPKIYVFVTPRSR